MLAPPLLAASLLFTGLSLCVLAFLLSRQDPPMPKLRVAAIITAVLGVVAFAVALSLWREIRLAAKTAASAPAPVYGIQTGTSKERIKQTVRACSLPPTLHRVELAIFVIPPATPGTG
jgi:hypothetical protein